MPMISDAGLVRIQNALVAKDRQNDSLKKRLKEGLQVDKTVMVLEVAGGGAAIGALRGKFEDANGAWNIANTSIDVELVVAIVLIGLSYYAGTKYGKALKKGEQHLGNLGSGVLAHYFGQIARNSVRQGSPTLVAGSALSPY